MRCIILLHTFQKKMKITSQLCDTLMVKHILSLEILKCEKMCISESMKYVQSFNCCFIGEKKLR